jgi:Winged helix-turn helix
VRKDLGNQIKQALLSSALPPQERRKKTQPIPRWTLKRFVQWVQQKWKIDCCRETVRKAIKQMGFSWKKAKKLLNKGNTAKRAEFLEKITELLDHLQPLPGYSPDFMPVEHLWQWLREDITYHVCYDQEQELISAVADFQHEINTTPIALSDRLWVKQHLNPEEEKLRFSK